MNPITSFIKRYPQGIFWGIAWLTFAFGWYMYKTHSSDLWQLLIWGSFLGGALVTGIADGRKGLKIYFSRIVRWRVGIQWYAVAVLLPLLLRLVAFGLNIVSGARILPSIQWPSFGDLIADFLIIFLVIALGEEPGFRGFALPRLMTGRTALMASLILGVLHTIWHAPVFITGDDPFITTTLIIISGAILNTWLFNNTNGSVFMAMFMHASVNLWGDVFRPVFSEADSARQEVWLAVAFVAIAILLPILTGKELGRKPEADMDMRTAEQAAVAR